MNLLNISINNTFYNDASIVIMENMDQDNLKFRLSTDIKKFRKEYKLSQFELAERAELSEQTINSIESRRLWPSDKTLLKICGVFDIDVYQLFLPEMLSLAYRNPDYAELKSAVVESVRHLVSQTLDEILKES